MRYLIFMACFLTAGPVMAGAEEKAQITQLGQNGEDTGKRSSAILSQIGGPAKDAGDLVHQIDPAQVSSDLDIDESIVLDDMSKSFPQGNCTPTADQIETLEFLRREGRFIGDDCEVLAWLDGKGGDDASERDIFNVIFGPEAERKQQADLERQEKEKAQAEAQARLNQMLSEMPSGGP